MSYVALSATSAIKSSTRPSDFEFQLHSVIGKLHVLRQRRIRRFVRQVMTNMSKERSPRFQPRHRRQRMLYSRMRRMRLVPQRIPKENIEPVQLIQGYLRNSAVIS